MAPDARGRARVPAAVRNASYCRWPAIQRCEIFVTPSSVDARRYWVDMGLDGFVLDAPPYYLAAPDAPATDGLDDVVVARRIREVVVDPLRQRGAAVFGEMYNFQRPTINKMLDGGRNTDMYDGTLGFPGQLHDAVVARDASSLEALLRGTVDVWTGWCGTPRTEPDSRTTADGVAAADGAAVGELKAAVTALLAGYYVVRFGVDCDSPYAKTPPSPGPGDEWPGGCYGDWAGAAGVAATLAALPSVPALRPGTPRLALPTGVANASTNAAEASAYAALRLPRPASDATDPAAAAAAAAAGEDAAVVVLNFSDEPLEVVIDLAASGVAAPQTSADIIEGGKGPPIPAGPAKWSVPLKARGWAAYRVALTPPGYG